MKKRRHQPDSPDLHESFLRSDRPHLLMITNHGIHQWQVVPGLPDTGGQNVFVNQFSEALAELGYRLTIVNRGGYPHPRTGEDQAGLRYRDRHLRILYLQDGKPEFVRKEDMGDQMPGLLESLKALLSDEASNIAAIISHYWDAGYLGMLWNRSQERQRPHIWIPHSLGEIKKRNVPAERWGPLRIEERIRAEGALLQEVSAVAATSATIRTSLTSDYGFAGLITTLPPCVDPQRYHPREVAVDDPIWPFLAGRGTHDPEEIPEYKIITEISRTDRTKRKDVLIRSFAEAHREQPQTLLIVSIDDTEAELAQELRALIGQLGLEDAVLVVGSVWDELPTLYAISDIYCTPSIMEGFGMSAQEAAATEVPVVASHLVPFATEYLLGEDPRSRSVAGSSTELRLGEGAIVAEANEVEAFAAALRLLLEDDELRDAMGNAAHRITIPAFTWSHRTRAFLEEVSLPLPQGAE